MKSKILLSVCATALMLSAQAMAKPTAKPAAPVYRFTPEEIVAARALNERILTLDTHLDTPAVIVRPGYDIMDWHNAHTTFSQVDYPRMVEGGLRGGFFAIYTSQGPLTPEAMATARDAALARGMAIHELVASHPDRFELAVTPADARRIQASGKRVVFMSIENSYPLGNDLTLLETFYKMGVRLAGPVHFANNQFGDSATDPKGKTWSGLSPLGKQFVTEANRLGIMLDASHASDDVLNQMIELSKTPVVLSHSGCKDVFNHPRNIDDVLLKKLADSGGVIQINSLSAYMIATPKIAERDAALGKLFASLGGRGAMMTPEKEVEIAKAMAEINAKYPIPRATFEDFMIQLLHALKVAGVDHVGIGLDLDGGGGVTGLEDVGDIPKITAALLQAGYTEADVTKIWGGNVMRIMEQTEAYAASLKKDKP